MPRRGENIYKRKDGRWEGRIMKQDGKYRYIYADTYKEVREKKKQLMIKATDESLASWTKEPACQQFERWLCETAMTRVRPSTYENYSCCINKYVIPFFKNCGNKHLDNKNIENFVNRIYEDERISKSYKRKLLSIFKTALSDISKQQPDINPLIPKISLPKIQESEIQVFSVNEQRLIESSVLASEDKRAIGILICIYTGIRLGELCGLKWCDIDFDARTMSISRTVNRINNSQGGPEKTRLSVGCPKSQRSIRKIPVPLFLLDLSDELKLNHKNGNCFILTGTESPLDPRTYQKLFKKILIRAGVNDRKFHATRHTFATRALELGVDIKTLSEILGHSSVSITLNIYAHSLMEQKKIAINKLNDMYLSHMGEAPIAVNCSVTTP